MLILKKTLYGLKQSAAEWHCLLSATFVELGYKPMDCSSCFWVKQVGQDYCLACHHVDDMAVTSSSEHLAFELRDTLKRKYGLSDGGDLSWHLGMNIVIKKGDYVHISQTCYIDSVAT